MEEEVEKTPEQINSELKQIVNKDYLNAMTLKAKDSVNGMLIGGVVFLVIGMYFKQNKLLFTALGALVGGLAGSQYNKYFKN